MPRTAPKVMPSPSSSAMSPDRRMSHVCRLSRHAITEADRSYPMPSLRFTKDHEWVRQEGDFAVIGITDYAQSQLGDVVYVELPEPGRHVEQGKEAAVVESAKAASEVYAPVTGEVVAVNDDIVADPAKVNADAMGEGWFIKIRLDDPKQLDGLMDETAYQAFVGEQP
jgi:glycine cleavage system H protein